MLTLNSNQIRYLRSAGHALHAVVMIGNNGLSETVMQEIDRSLNAHELIKIKVAGDARELRVQILQEICEKLGAAAVQHIGKQLLIYRPAAEPRIVFPKN